VNTKKLDGTTLKKQSLESIAYDYYSTNFALDLITNIPFYFIDLKRKRMHIFYAIKILRIKKGFRLFDVTKVMSIFKNRNKLKI
jgi:hypothetical protein